MIPLIIADRLKNDKEPKNMCEVLCQFNNLLYSMIYYSIGDRLKNSEDPLNTCEVICQFNNLLYSMIN